MILMSNQYGSYGKNGNAMHRKYKDIAAKQGY